MPYADLTTHRLYYETQGPESGEPLVLIHGLGAQLIAWFPGFVAELEKHDFRVVLFDNRDIGLSSEFPHDALYTVDDMAADVVGLMDHLGLDSAHIAGQSMGGMIAQQFAITYPERLRSLCSIYSAPHIGFRRTDDPYVQEVRGRRPAADRDSAIAHYIEQERISGLDGLTEQEILEFATAVYDRSHRPDGQARQQRAIMDAPDRRPGLAGITVPTVVIHGRDDRLIDFTGGIATAQAVPDSELHVYAGMGHQIPPHLWSDTAGVIARNARRRLPDRAVCA
ncbi:alpha/beta hydrolase [Pseudonocardia sp. RS11V-5]|uniref:alpha/beta fold hydrolase n=1 Tax=Pseudonocardia terrae TaxID=2905831 RepID=UPI001E6330E3|nr:alpha/beta fold hydrolase [Pseudonocardia terrae]MCE3555910.1 alpha/beta hydrolase [Pseudonocardia terrae]